MKRYLLDTNIVSYLLKEHKTVVLHILSVPMSSLCISVITEAELLFGLAKRPDAKRLHRAVTEFLKRVDVLPWDSMAAATYGTLRAGMQQRGYTLAPHDLLIASHALSLDAILVSNDQGFSQVPGLTLEDWLT